MASSRSLMACWTTSACSCTLCSFCLSSVFSCCSWTFWRRKKWTVCKTYCINLFTQHNKDTVVALKWFLTLSATLRWITVTAARSVLAQPNPTIMGRYGRWPSLTDMFVHHWVTWSLSSCAALGFPHWSPVLSTKARFSSWDRDVNRERSGVGRAFHRHLHQKEFLWRWPICLVLRGRTRMGRNI